MSPAKLYICGKQEIKNDEIGLNKKLISRNPKRFYCINCLAEEFEVTTEELHAKIEEFKEQGCAIF